MSQMTEKRPEFRLKSTVSIEPYFDPDIPNMGFEKYGMSGFPGGSTVEDIGYFTIGNKISYLTGLDENSENVRSIQDPEERKAKLAELKKVVKYLEQDCNLGEGTLDPTNVGFWSKIRLEIMNNGRLDLDMKDPQDIIKYHAIKGGGIKAVAPDFESARKAVVPPKWFLQELTETAAIKTEVKKLRNEAIAELQHIFKKNQKDLFYIAKVLLSAENQFKYSTPVDILYDKLDDFINGVVVKTNKKQTPSQFMETCKTDKKTLHVKAILRDAVFYKQVIQRQDGFWMNISTQSALGRNENEMVEYLKNPINQSELDSLSESVEKRWNQ